MHCITINTGCTVDSLLDTDRDPECSKREGDMCTCTVMSSDGRYGMMYDGTSVGSTAHLFTNNSYCYNRPHILERTCQDNGNWNGETVNTTDIVTGTLYYKSKKSLLRKDNCKYNKDGMCILTSLHFAKFRAYIVVY